MRFFGDKLHKAAQKGDEARVQKLLQKGFDPNEPNNEGVPPLFYTANTGSVACARLLIDSGADVNFAVSGGGRPLHSAILKKHEDLARWLILKGADVNAATAVGVTPLHLAAQNGMAATVAGLLREGADINARTQKGQTALFLAFFGMFDSGNDDSAVLVLFEAGADPRLPEEFENILTRLAEVRENIAATLKYGLARLAEKSENPEIRDYAQKRLNQLCRMVEEEEDEPFFIESSVLGRMMAKGDDWWESEELPIPFFEGKRAQVTYRFNPKDDPDFISEADAAMEKFLRKSAEERFEATPFLDDNFKLCSEILYDEVTRDMLQDWQREILDYEDRNRLWEHLAPRAYISVERRHRRDRDIYILLAYACGWEEEHGLQLVYRRGLELTRVSQQDGWSTEADAFGLSDEEDELLNAFNLKYGCLIGD